MTNTKSFVHFVCLLALFAAGVLWVTAPPTSNFGAATVATLALLALIAELMGFLLPRGAAGSIAFIPYMTALILVPNFLALVTVTGAGAVAALARRRGAQKELFNVAQLLLSYAVAIGAFRALGGVSLFTLRDLPVAEVTLRVGLPLMAAYALVFAINTLLVSHVVAITTNSRTIQVWRENTVSTIGVDILALPLLFVFAWVYAKWGPMIASLLWLPILGLRQLNTTNLELAQTNRELLELMVKSIEARDPYTSGHSRRVREYAIKLSRLMGLPAAEVEKIGTAALLHDVGKIYDKYAPILAKEERLTPDEWSVIKEHPQDGANLIATMTRLRELVPAVRHHHENWDGTGYPDGLKETDIPLASRVIMFADTIDAMTTERPYRGPLGEDIVRAELLRCRGRQFDPQLTDQLLSCDFWGWLFPPTARVNPHAGILRLVSTKAARG